MPQQQLTRASTVHQVGLVLISRPVVALEVLAETAAGRQDLKAVPVVVVAVLALSQLEGLQAL